MKTKFFNNTADNTLFEKFAGIAEGMGAAFHSFLAVSGYFRSSGYFKLREKLGDVRNICIFIAKRANFSADISGGGGEGDVAGCKLYRLDTKEISIVERKA
jgi:hypothetical protein